MVDFGKLTANKKQIQQIISNQQINESSALPKIDYSNVNSIFNSNKTDGTTNSTANIAMIMAGGEDALKAMSEDQIKQYATTAALMDQDGDGVISEEEFEALDGKSGVANTAQIDSTDIQALYDEMNIANDKSMEDLLNEVNAILDGINIEEEAAAVEKGAPSIEKTGISYDEETGEYSVTVEKYQSGKAINDDGNQRYPNGSFWGIVTNAYPDATEAEKRQIYDMIGEMNGYDCNNHVLHPGDNVKLPILTRDENGKITGYEKAEETKETTGDVSNVTNEPKMVGNRGYEADYEIKNADGSVTRFTVAAGKEANIENATGFVSTDKVVNGQMQSTVVAKDGSKTVYTYSGAKVDGKPIDKKVYDANGNLVVPEEKPETTTTAPETTTTATKEQQENYGYMLGEAKTLLEKSIENGDWEEFDSKFEEYLNGNAITDEQKAVLFTELFTITNSANNNGFTDTHPAQTLVTLYGDKVDTQTRANALSKLAESKNWQTTYKGDSSFEEMLFRTANEMTEAGDLDKAVELLEKFENREDASIYVNVDEQVEKKGTINEEWTKLVSNMYTEAASQGKLSEITKKFDPQTMFTEKMKNDLEDEVIGELFTNLTEELPDEFEYATDFIKDQQIDKYTSGSISENLDAILNSNLDDNEKAFLLRQVMQDSDFTNDFREMDASNQREYLNDILKYIADFTEA